MMKTRFFLLLILAVLTVVCAAALANGETEWYQCGHYRYMIMDDGNVKIDRYCGEEEEIIIPAELDGRKVTAVGDGAFVIYEQWNRSTEFAGPSRVIIPEGVTSIGSRAFCGCSKLETVSIPDSIESIGDLAFMDCPALTGIAIPDGLTDLGANPFFLLSPEYLQISPNHPYYEIRDGMLIRKEDGCLISGAYARDGETSVVIPEGIRRIGDYAFFCRSNITGVTFPDSLTEIGNNAFSYCSGLSSLPFPNSLVSIGDYAFMSCRGLDGQTVVIPDSVTRVGDDPFAYCWPEIRFSDHHPCLEIANGALYSKPDSRLIRRIERAADQASVREGTRVIGGTVFRELPLPENFSIPEGVVSIGDRAFGGLYLEDIIYLKYPIVHDLKLPDSLERIGEAAFSAFPFEEDLHFSGTAAPFSLQIPEGVNEMGAEAFSYSSFSTLNVPGSLKVVSRGAFQGCRELTDAVLSDGVAIIGERAFHGSGLIHITLPETLRFIGDEAFSGCPLAEITLPEGLAYIGSRVFAGCPPISLAIPDSVTAVSPLAFDRFQGEILVSPDHPCLAVVNGALMEKQSGCLLRAGHAEEEVCVIPEGTRIIRDYLFCEAKKMESVVIPYGVTEIGAYAFYGARRLSGADIPASVTTIGSHAFFSCRLESVVLAEGLEKIGSYAFANNNKLSDLRIPDSVSFIGEGAFDQCSKLVLTVSPGSYAEQYCIENSLKYQPLSDAQRFKPRGH